MNLTIRISPQAAGQIRTAHDWWVRNRSKAPEAFAEEVERAFDLIKALPDAGEPVRHPHLPGVRRLLLGRIRYYLYYVKSIDQDIVDVLACWHTARGTAPEIPFPEGT